MTTQEILNLAVLEKTGLAVLSEEKKNEALSAMADALERETPRILSENEKDMEQASGTISEVMLDRLMLNKDRIHAMAEGIRDIIKLPDPVGCVLSETVTKDGLKLKKVSVPMGVTAISYESRPNVTSDAAALSLKSGNVCILRSGKEAYRTSKVITEVMREAVKSTGLSENVIQIIDDTTRQSSLDLMKARGYVDLLIPRGGAGLIRACVENASVPCIETGTGICTVYVDKAADLQMALDILDNAKTQRPSVCNAAEQCLVHEDIAAVFLPALKKRLTDERSEDGKIPVELRLSKKAALYITGTEAGPDDFDTEFLDYILAVDVVRGTEEAVKHIERHSTHHSEAIITADEKAADYFTSRVDSAAVYVNASTRFTDGGCFGLGCEMGISTQKLHARGPMGLNELTSYKYIITGNGQTR